jgi:hypothetical protein
MVESDVAMRNTPVQIGGFEQEQNSSVNRLPNVGIMKTVPIATMMA